MSDTFFFYSPKSYTLSVFHDRLAAAGLSPSRQHRFDDEYQINAGPNAMFLFECPDTLREEMPEAEPLSLAAIGPCTGWLAKLRYGHMSFFAPFCLACIDDPHVVVPFKERIIFGPEFCKLVQANPDDAFDLANS